MSNLSINSSFNEQTTDLESSDKPADGNAAITPSTHPNDVVADTASSDLSKLFVDAEAHQQQQAQRRQEAQEARRQADERVLRARNAHD